MLQQEYRSKFQSSDFADAYNPGNDKWDERLSSVMRAQTDAQARISQKTRSDLEEPPSHDIGDLTAFQVDDRDAYNEIQTAISNYTTEVGTYTMSTPNGLTRRGENGLLPKWKMQRAKWHIMTANQG